jgi:hypothetical protein
VKSLTVLQPVLTLLADNIDILPAVGGAVEDLLRPDVEEMEDMLINKGLLARFGDMESAEALTREMERTALSNDAVFPPLLWTGKRHKTPNHPVSPNVAKGRMA